MLAIYQLIFRNFIKSWYNIFFGLILPFILAIIVCLSWSLMDLIRPVHMIPASSYISIVTLGLISLPLCICRFRQANIIQRISSSKYSTYDFLAAVFIFYLVMDIIAYVFNLSVTTLVVYWSSSAAERTDIANMFNYADYLGVVYVLIILIFMTNFIGMAIGMWAKEQLTIQVIGTTFILINVILGLWIVPYALLCHEIGGAVILQMAYIDPYKYITAMFTEAFLRYDNPNGEGLNLFGSSIFDIFTPFATSILNMGTDAASQVWVNMLTTTDKMLNIIIPTSVLLGAIGMCTWSYLKDNAIFFSTKSKPKKEAKYKFERLLWNE